MKIIDENYPMRTLKTDATTLSADVPPSLKPILTLFYSSLVLGVKVMNPCFIHGYESAKKLATKRRQILD